MHRVIDNHLKNNDYVDLLWYKYRCGLIPKSLWDGILHRKMKEFNIVLKYHLKYLQSLSGLNIK